MLIILNGLISLTGKGSGSPLFSNVGQTVRGQSSFGTFSLGDFIFLAVFLIIQSVLIFVLLANLRKRKKAEAELKKVHLKLGRRVKERTAEIEAVNENLKSEIEERKLAEKRLQKLLEQEEALSREKEILLAEVHHRVKNNFMIVSSMLNLQASKVSDPLALKLFQESKARVKALAMIHEKLYLSSDLSGVDFKDFIQSLARDLFESYTVDPESITLTTEIDDISLGVDLAIPCCMIICELLTNSIKYAFPPLWSHKGEIRIALNKTEDGEARLSVTDNGIGIPAGFSPDQGDSLGMKIVSVITKGQLSGRLEIETDQGTCIHITFPI